MDRKQLVSELKTIKSGRWEEPHAYAVADVALLAELAGVDPGSSATDDAFAAIRRLLTDLADELEAEEREAEFVAKPDSVAVRELLMLDQARWRATLTERREAIRKQWLRRNADGEYVPLASARSFAGNQEDNLIERVAARLAGQQSEPTADAAPVVAPTNGRPRPVRSEWPGEHRPVGQQEMVLLLASPSMRSGPSSPLIRLVREFEPYWRLSRPLIFAVEGAYKEIWRAGLLHDYEDRAGSPPRYFSCLPSGASGGVVHATELIVAAESHQHANVCVIYLMDPRDPASLYPETAALKRECLLANVPYLNSGRGAARWLALEWACSAGARRARGDTAPLVLPREAALAIDDSLEEHDGAVALAAHDRHKPSLMSFAEQHADLLTDDFSRRYATGATGHLLNGGPVDDLGSQFGYYDMEGTSRDAAAATIERMQDEWRSRQPVDGELGSDGWATTLAHGRRGGLVQLARKVLDEDCRTIVFLQDAETPREDDMDIKLLDRATQMASSDCLVLHNAQSADRWANNRRRAVEMGQLADPLTLVDAYRRRFGVELVLAHFPGRPPRGPRTKADAIWSGVVRRAATHVVGLVLAAVKRRREQYQPARLGVSWGGVMCDIVGMPDGGSELRRALAMRAEIDRMAGRDLRSSHATAVARGKWPLEELPSSAVGKVRDSDLTVVPTVGLVGSQNPVTEAQAIARRAVDALGGKALSYPELAFQFREGAAGEESAALQAEWRELDVLVCNCDIVRERPGERLVGLPAELYDAVKNAAGAFGTIYLERYGDTVSETQPARFRQSGISFDQVRALAEKPSDESEVVLVAGARAERQLPAWAALEAGLVSTLVTDPQFAWELLCHDRDGNWPKGE